MSAADPAPTPRTVVFLHAHPDDEAIFTGATMRRLADTSHRVVLVTATDGGQGVTLHALGDESVASRRHTELEAAASELGVARLVTLGYRDSGLLGDSSNTHPDAYMNADVERDAHVLADLLRAEGSDTLVHYDSNGIYGHPDHVMVNRVGARAAELAGVTAYEATVDREHLHFVDGHLVTQAGGDATAVALGHVSVEITTALRATPAELAAKRAAMAAHTSQISDAALDTADFADLYEYEWYVRRQGPPTLERLGNTHAISPSGDRW